jgi:DNA-binding NtrC family response regulator
MDGTELFLLAKDRFPDTRTVLISAHGTIRDALKAIGAGAEGYLPKPFDRDELLAVVGRAMEKAALLRENASLKQQLHSGTGPHGLVGRSKPMLKLLSTMKKVASAAGTVLILGESGTGKEMVARAIHRMSAFRDGPFVPVSCASLPETLIETELYGVKAGAFTGATADRAGYVERASGGTLFLDEIGDVSLLSQTALLRVLEGGQTQRVGGVQGTAFPIRIIAATHRDLRALIGEGRFREDLFYRLHVLPVHVPPLRERREDIPLLVSRFLEDVGRPELMLTPAALEFLKGMEFKGNVRELRNLVERLAGTHETSLADAEDLQALLESPSMSSPEEPAMEVPLREALGVYERKYLLDLLRRTGGNVSEAARLAGVSRVSLLGRLSHFRIDPAGFRLP